MVKVVPDRLANQPPKINLGRQLLDIVTSGMYNQPLMVLREYIQNAADSIDEVIDRKYNSLSPQEAKIEINVYGNSREISVCDNGTGISEDQVESRLLSLGNSQKEGKNKRGFRGIGRLGGLGYCDLLRFETRSNSKENVTVVEWDGLLLNKISKNCDTNYNLEKAIREIVCIKKRLPNKNEPSHFFKVTMTNVHRFHSDILMNLTKINEYLAQVAPVPYLREGFKFGAELNSFFSEIPNYRTYNVYVNGEKIYKPYIDCINLGKNLTDKITDIKKLKFTNSQNGELIGLGWFALTSFQASMPSSILMRGIRVRHGNIEVGDERFLENIYSERRFALWHIGEIHLNHNIKPNARRDSFEENSDYELFLERMHFIGKGLSKLCRESSLKRCAQQRIESEIKDIKKEAQSNNLLFDNNQKNEIMNRAESRINKISEIIKKHDIKDTYDGQIKSIQKQILLQHSDSQFFVDFIDGRKIINIPQKNLLEEVCKKIITLHKNYTTIEETIMEAIKPYLKDKN